MICASVQQKSVYFQLIFHFARRQRRHLKTRFLNRRIIHVRTTLFFFRILFFSKLLIWKILIRNMFVKINENFVICLITIITFKFFNHNIKIFIDFVVKSRNSCRIAVLSFLLKWTKSIRDFINSFEVFRQRHYFVQIYFETHKKHLLHVDLNMWFQNVNISSSGHKKKN